MSWISRLTNALDPRRLDAELAEEMRDHIERRAADLRGQGLSADEARRQSASAFGNLTALQEKSRDVRLWAALEGSCQDARYAWRGLMRNPIFAVTAVVSLGLAIGANTAIYSIVDAALLRPLPVPRADRLITLTAGEETFSYRMYEDLRAVAGGAVQLALLGSPNRVEAQASADAPYEEVTQQFVSPEAFDVLGVPPALGQLFSAREDRYPGARAAVVLSHEYWRRRFGADASVIGRKFIADGREFAILGVAREGFHGSEPGKFIDVWLPVGQMDPGIFENPEIRLFHIMGRLAEGVGSAQTAAALQPAFHRHQSARAAAGAAMPRAMRTQLMERKLLARSGSNGISAFRERFAKPLWILLGVAACTLLIACANVASLLLARSTARGAEMALRVSLGARRARLVRQLLTESLLIALMAGLLGWMLASAAAPALVDMVSSQRNPVRLDLSLDGQVLWFCAAVCGFSALFFGLLPAWTTTSGQPVMALRQSSGQAARLRTGRLFVGIQVAFAFCLVAGGSSFLFSLHRLTAVDTGFDARGVTVLTMINATQRDRQLPMLEQVQLRIAALPRVQAVAAAWTPILGGPRRAQRVALPGKAPGDREETFYRVSPGYFAALGTPLLEGRDFLVRDNDDEPVRTVVNRAFAKRYFGNETALGREFRRDDGVRHLIVGIAANSHFGDLRGGPEAIAYMPMKPPRAFTLYVRSTLDAASVAKMVEREGQSLGSGVRVRDVTTLEAQVGRTILTERLLAGIGGAFALLGLILAAIGLFGLLNYTVTLRTKEIGIRSALGARRLSIYGLVLRDMASMIGGGLAVGLAGSLALMRVTQSLQF
jgi:predicted permease